MRLINTKTLKVKEFFNLEDVPEYAILSHTWEGQAEVTYQEFIDPDDRIRNRTGFEKIRKCCYRARTEGYQYAWVDTCCIDKTSTAELSEAINSMWNWYRDSSICYVYLSDHAQTTEDGLCERKYWTRSWTLQELIAPEHVTFFNRDWDVIGTKKSLALLISSITGIHGDVLQDSSRVFDYSIAQRFSWAARRKATRLEDQAYSLLGIFQVNMPMIYGERDNAFLRLQKEILKESEDRSILAWRVDSPTSENTRNNLLAHSVAAFADCSKITKSNPSYYGTAMVPTGRGLSLEIPLAPYKRRVFKALLGCQNERGDQQLIYLQKLLPENGANIYRRWHRAQRGQERIQTDVDDREFLKTFAVVAPDERQARHYSGRNIEFAHPQGPPAITFSVKPNMTNFQNWELTVVYREKLFDLEDASYLNEGTSSHGEFRHVSVPLSFVPYESSILAFKPRSRDVFQAPDFLFFVIIVSRGTLANMTMGFSFDGYNPDPKLRCHQLQPLELWRYDRPLKWERIAAHYMSHAYFAGSPPAPRGPLRFSGGESIWGGNLVVQIHDSYVNETGTRTLSGLREQAGYSVEFSPVSISPIPLYDSFREFWSTRSAPLLLLLVSRQEPFRDLMIYAFLILATIECMEQSWILGYIFQIIAAAMLPRLLVLVSVAIIVLFSIGAKMHGSPIPEDKAFVVIILSTLSSLFAPDWPIRLLNLQPYVDIRAYPRSVPILIILLARANKWRRWWKDWRYHSWTQIILDGIFGLANLGPATGMS